MDFLIDGYNLMHAAGLMKPRFGPGGLEKARLRLLGLLAGSLGQAAARTTVVFDGPAPGHGDQAGASSSFHGIRVEFSVGAEKADAHIEQLIRAHSAPKQLTVISSDQRIRTAARRRRATSVTSDAFFERLLAPRGTAPASPASPAGPEKPAAGSSSDSDFWVREFEPRVNERDLRELSGPDFEEDET